MKIAIIDDELHNRLVLKRIIQNNCPDLDIVVEEGTVAKAVEEINTKKPDLVFLDIRLKNGTGFDILKELTCKPKIIFTTAYSEYVIQAFKVQAVDYILKPIDEKELIDSVIKAKQMISVKAFSSNNFYNYTNGTGKKTISFDKIYYFESSGSYTTIITEDEKILLSKNIGEVEKELPENDFYRTHNSYIVNLKKVRSVDVKRSGQINLSNNIAIPVSQRKLRDFLDLIKAGSFSL